MVAILGLPLETVETICARARERTHELVEVANDNEPTQVVLAGQAAAVAEAVAAAKEAGAVKAVRLSVGAPFHCGLMAPMSEAFGRALDRVTFHEPVVEVISSVTAEPVNSARQARDLLARQVTERVRWREVAQGLAGQGVQDVVECGPGKVLAGLTSRTAPDLRTHVTDASPGGCDAVRDLLFAADEVPVS
jgi:[acyl-carrier-protein] S-malonyltransferase